MSSSASLQLSPLVNGSKQVTITVQEGVPLEFDPSTSIAVSTASRSNVGVATRLRLISYKEDVPPIGNVGAQTISILKGVSTLTGNQMIVPLASDSNGTVPFSGSYSAGTSSLIVSSTRQSEKVLFCYDPVSLSAEIARGPFDRFVFQDAPNNASFGVTPVWTTAAIQAEIVLIRDTSTNEYWLAVRAFSALNINVLGPAHQTSAPGGSRTVRFSLQEPTIGVGWAVYDQERRGLFEGADIHLDSSISPIRFQITPTVSGDSDNDEWVAYRVISLGGGGVSGDLRQVFFGASPPLSGATSSRSPAVVSRILPTNAPRRKVTAIFNAEEVLGSNTDRSGGIAIR